MSAQLYTIKWIYRHFGLSGDAQIAVTKEVAETTCRNLNHDMPHVYHWSEPVEWQHYAKEPQKIGAQP